MYDDLYCKVFVDTKLDYEEVFSRVMNYVDGKKESFSYIVTDWCDMFIQRNKEYTEEQYLKDTGNFIYWRYYIDIEPTVTDEVVYIEKIKDLIKYLRKYCDNVVAACDFENELDM